MLMQNINRERNILKAIIITTWSATDKSSNFTLSNNNLTSTISSGTGLQRATKSAPNKNTHFEVTLSGISGFATVGLATSTEPLDGSGQLNYLDSVSWQSNGNIRFSNKDSGLSSSFGNGDVLGFDYNKVDGTVVLSKNNSVVGSLSVNSNASLFPCLYETSGNSMTGTLNAGASAFTSNPNSVVSWNS